MESALNQYIKLFEEHSALIDSHSAPVLNEARPRALENLKNMILPKEGSENYEQTDLQKILEPDYGLNLARINIDVNPAVTFRCNVPRLSTDLFLTVNDKFVRTSSVGEFPEGVFVGSLAEAARLHPELVRRYYNSEASGANPIAALNTLLCQDGMFVYIPKGVTLERPLQLVNILQNGAPLMAVRRLLIVVDDNAEARLLTCDHTQTPEIDFLALQTVEIFAGRNSRFDLYDMEESTERTSRLSALYLRQEEGSRVVLDGITLFNGTTRNEYYCRFAGRHAELQLLGMAIEDCDRRIDTYTRIDHAVPDCTSNELIKYVADDSARASFCGRIYVAEGACRTNAYQTNRNILSSDSAKIYSKPQLEIYNDDVKCSHGSAIGQLDELQIFYMRTRGIPLDEAKRILKQAFMADVIDAVRLPALRERLHQLVDLRFAGEIAACAGCEAACFAQHK